MPPSPTKAICIWQLPTAPAPLLRLTRTKAAETAPAFSPDGTLLASMRGGQVIVQNLSNGQIWQATEIESGTLNGYDWSPDGKTLVCNVGKGEHVRSLCPTSRAV